MISDGEYARAVQELDEARREIEELSMGKVDCPFCNGTGKVPRARYMGNVRCDAGRYCALP